MALKTRHHRLIRVLAGAVTVGSLSYAAHRGQVRKDVTSEGLSELTDGTQTLIRSIGVEKPVTVHAFISREVPRAFVTVRSRLLNVLREMEAAGGDGLRVRVVEPKRHSPEAQEAMDTYGIMPRRMIGRTSGNEGVTDMFLGIAFSSGPREEVIPFVDRGLSVEYEVTRALRVVTQDKKKVLGILRTDAAIMGNFDMKTMRQIPAWQIIGELKKQYDVRTLNAQVDVPEDVDVLLVPQLSSLSQPEMDKVRAYVDAGRPALLTVDPLPIFDLRLSPSEKKLPPPGSGGGGFMGGGGGAPAEPKGDYLGLLRDVGVEWAADKVLRDTENPHPNLSHVPPHVIFARGPFAAGADPAVQGLTEVVVLFGGRIKPSEGHAAEFTPLLQTSPASSYNRFDEMVQRHMLFGLSGPVVPPKGAPLLGEPLTVAARIRGGERSAVEGEGKEEATAKPKNLIVVSDIDLFGDTFFSLHNQGGDVDGDGLDDVRFDNVTFLLNAVDTLAGDDRFLELRRRQPAYRRLDRVDDLTRFARAERQSQMEAASGEADAQIAEAQKALTERVEEIRNREGLDENTKAIMAKSAEEAENRRLQAKQEKIEREKARAVARIETEHARREDEVRNGIRLAAVLIPPLPPLIFGGLLFARKRRREQDNIPEARRKGQKNSGGEA